MSLHGNQNVDHLHIPVCNLQWTYDHCQTYRLDYLETPTLRVEFLSRRIFHPQFALKRCKLCGVGWQCSSGSNDDQIIWSGCSSASCSTLDIGLQCPRSRIGLLENILRSGVDKPVSRNSLTTCWIRSSVKPLCSIRTGRSCRACCSSVTSIPLWTLKVQRTHWPTQISLWSVQKMGCRINSIISCQT